jgi:excinuclease ABC subunit A
LDEPTVGLHPRDTQRLIDTLKRLRDLGNTLIVVEHDEEVLNQADWLLDFGPKAGKEGGFLVAEGTPADIKQTAQSLTGQFLAHQLSLGEGKGKPITAQTHWLVLHNCQEHNLKDLTVRFPLGHLTLVTGVSGSGKSSLITDTLYPALKQFLHRDFRHQPGRFSQLLGAEEVSQVFLVDQSPIGRTSRSNPATYTGIFTDIRELFGQTKEARKHGFTASHFSFNTQGGRCEACDGQGQIRIQMQFLADLWVECAECHGQRFKNEILEVEYQEKNIAGILRLTVKEALAFFAPFAKIVHKLKTLAQIGLDYLELGQASPTLSGGESQRLKLARELVRKNQAKTVYLLDEPTTGLHFADLQKLLAVLRTLVDRGHTVILIEHNLSLIRQADWLIDLGPEGGEQGGYLVAEGPPDQVAQNPQSWTGAFLK